MSCSASAPVSRAGATRHRGERHTVVIEPEERRLMRVWHTATPRHHTPYAPRETAMVGKERPGPGTPAGRETARGPA